MEILPRLRGDNKHHINYRHVIDWLIRKPGAFEHYRYRDCLFPTSRFRMAYDDLRRCHSTAVASREYLRILELAARENETAVDDALRELLDAGVAVEADSVERRLAQDDSVSRVTEVTVDMPDLVDFDSLLEEQEVLDGNEQGCKRNVDWSSAGVAPADVP
jgi:hypothetical protein